jgi:excisionase family DNA binding protein
MERLLRPKEVADLFAVKLSTLYSWLHRGQGPPVVKLPSGSIRFRKQSVEAWLQKAERSRSHSRSQRKVLPSEETKPAQQL